MKNTIVFAVLLYIVTNTASAQTYSFSYMTGTYTDLVGSTSLNNDSTWDNSEFLMRLEFDINGQFHSELYVGGPFISTNSFYNYSESSLIIPSNSDLADRAFDLNGYSYYLGSLSPISYLTEGPGGDRITKIEWNNAGFYDDIDNDNDCNHVD